MVHVSIMALLTILALLEVPSMIPIILGLLSPINQRGIYPYLITLVDSCSFLDEHFEQIVFDYNLVQKELKHRVLRH